MTLLLTFVVPLVYPVDPLDVDSGNALAPPSAAHPLGTDDVGRDILARLADAGRLDMLIAFAVTGLALVVGSLLGAMAGYAGGLVDDVFMRIVDVMLSFPAFILALAVTVMLGNKVGYVIAALAVAYTPFFVRLTRGRGAQDPRQRVRGRRARGRQPAVAGRVRARLP